MNASSKAALTGKSMPIVRVRTLFQALERNDRAA
jgi:hypothetical protein